jgi:hypothetical protein
LVADELFSPPNLSDINKITQNITKIDENFSHINNRLSKNMYQLIGSNSVMGTNALDYRAYTLNMTDILNYTSANIMFKADRYYTVSMDTCISDVSDIRILTARGEFFSNLQRIFRGNLFQYKVIGTTNSCTLTGNADIVTFDSDQNSITVTVEIIQFIRNPSDKPVLLTSRVNILEIG